ncbi:MAG: hypothetical protein ACT4NY_27140 [Pseudonocardiales bacterium]
MDATDLAAPLGHGVINLATLEKILSRAYVLMCRIGATRGVRVRRRPE